MRIFELTILAFVLSAFGCTAPTGAADGPSTTTPGTGPTPPPTFGGTETCGDGLDGDIDGQVDEGCSCEVGTTQGCWPGDPSKRSTAPCIDGVQECVPNGEFASWGECWGAQLPTGPSDCLPSMCAMSELGGCSDGDDDDCDGLVDCADPDCGAEVACLSTPPPDDGTTLDCRCVPGTNRYCHVDVSCEWGSQVCRTDGSWDTCQPMGWGVVPAGCEGGGGGGGWDDPFFDDWGYSVSCCVANGYCCDNLDYDYTLYDPTRPEHASVGECSAQCAD